MTREPAPSDLDPALHSTAPSPHDDANAPTLQGPPREPAQRPSKVDVRPTPLQEQSPESRYAVTAHLGSGGMGEVQLCLDHRLGRQVARKQLHARSTAHLDAQERFLREVRVQGQLEHPAIVPVYDLGVDSQGAPYFTMKRIHGVTLQHVLEGLRAGDAELEKRFSLRKLLTAFSNVCLALEYAHERGVIHRDLKPANIMLGDFGEVYLLDWGIARVQNATHIDAGNPSLKLTRNVPGSGPVLLGTPGYMSPEQAQGRTSELDGRADVYSLGAILFEVLTLQTLHPGKKPLELVDQTLAGADAHARKRAPQRHIARELEELCVQATKLDPKERLPSARALSDALEQYLDGSRDLERRRELAEQHANAAAEALAQAQHAGDASEEQRSRALREVGRALAYDSTHTSARRSLMRLFTELPRKAPEAARRRIERAQEVSERFLGGMAAAGFAAWALYTLAFGAMGFRRLDLFLVTLLCYVLAALGGLSAALGAPWRKGLVLFVGLMAACGNALACWYFSPFLFAQTGAVAVTMCFMLYPWRAGRIPLAALGIASNVLPAVLQHLSLAPRAFEFRDGNLVILPFVLNLPPNLTFATLTLVGAASIVVGCTLLAVYRERFARAEEQLHVVAWQLEQVVAEDLTSEDAGR